MNRSERRLIASLVGSASPRVLAYAERKDFEREWADQFEKEEKRRELAALRVLCSKCGKKTSLQASYCQHCGTVRR